MLMLMQGANEMLERTTGKQDSSLEPRDTNGSPRSRHFYREKWWTNGFNLFDLYLLKVLGAFRDLIQPSALPLKAVLLYMCHTYSFQLNAAFT